MSDIKEIECVFCDKIKNNDYEGENERCVWFTPLNPVVDGHILVVHKNHTDDFTENSQISAEVMAYASELAEKIGGDFNLITSKGKSATQSINHLHVHLVPRKENDGLSLPWSQQQDKEYIKRSDVLEMIEEEKDAIISSNNYAEFVNKMTPEEAYLSGLDFCKDSLTNKIKEEKCVKQCRCS